jgi:hypothetical protein
MGGVPEIFQSGKLFQGRKCLNSTSVIQRCMFVSTWKRNRTELRTNHIRYTGLTRGGEFLITWDSKLRILGGRSHEYVVSADLWFFSDMLLLHTHCTWSHSVTHTLGGTHPGRGIGPSQRPVPCPWRDSILKSQQACGLRSEGHQSMLTAWNYAKNRCETDTAGARTGSYQWDRSGGCLEWCESRVAVFRYNRIVSTRNKRTGMLLLRFASLEWFLRKITVFWGVTFLSLVDTSRRFRITCRIYRRFR